MRAKTILTALFLISLVVATWVILQALPQKGDAVAERLPQVEVLVATVPLAAGTLLRAQDVTWQPVARAVEPGEIVRPSEAARAAKPELDEEARAEVYGAALRGAVVPGDPIRRGPLAAGDPIRRGGVARPGDRDFLQIVLSPGARAIAIPVTTGGASTGILYPGDRVDIVLTQKFGDTGAPLTRRSVSETVVENLRVLAINVPDAKAAGGNAFGQTVTLEVTPEQAEKMNVAAELGKLSLTLRSITTAEGVLATSTAGPGKATGVRPTWAGDVSPALGGAMPDKVLTAQRPPVEIIRGKGVETRKTE
ncbi:MAG: Flp pilus assembly protein CpaB [Alphaproteobacteria bacterium]|jgi:pilus assembly protein CpaB|nr:MAG: Flp pilus assembly protein CpaB [Alphaproteobacteria bacterium]